MLLLVEERERIRRAYHVERKSIRQIARETGHCREAIRRAIDEGPPETTLSQYPGSRPSPIFGPFQSRIEALLTQSEQLPRKQRYTHTGFLRSSKLRATRDVSHVSGNT